MSLIKTIPWKALGIFTLGITIGLYLGAKGAVSAIIKVFDSESVSKSINKPTNQNNTTIDFKDNKFKKTDSINITLNQKPKSTQEIVQKLDSCVIGKKDYSKLTNSQKNRLGRWIKD